MVGQNKENKIKQIERMYKEVAECCKKVENLMVGAGSVGEREEYRYRLNKLIVEREAIKRCINILRK